MAEIFLAVSKTKHLAQGSTCPEGNPKIVRLYNMMFCPYTQRTRLVLAAKKIPFELVNINLMDKPDWYFAKNPSGKVPCLEFGGGKIVYESLITADYLDDAYPHRSLRSSDSYRRAQDRMWLEYFLKVTLHMSNLYRFKAEEEAVWKENLEGLRRCLGVYEKELDERGTLFFGGEQPGMLDYMIWPWFERMPLLPILTQGVVDVALADFQKLWKWSEEMKEDPAVQESYLSPQNHSRYMKNYLGKTLDYDMELV